MSEIATTKMSSKGQVVIPDPIRKRMNLKAGEQFIVLSDNEDVVILKRIAPPSLEEFDELIARARLVASEAGMTPSDIEAAIQEARNDRSRRS